MRQLTNWNRDISPAPLQYAVHNVLDQAAKGDVVEPAIERGIVSEYMHDLFLFFSSDPKLCCDQIVNLPASYETKFTIIEAIISHMLLLPKCNQHMVFFGRVIVDLFRRQPKIWPRVLGATINNIFHKIDKVDIESRRRFAAWFALHLSNFNFQWPWANWAFVATFPEASPKRVFIRSALGICQNLAYHERIKKGIPPDLQELLPAKVESTYKYSRSREEAKATAKNGRPLGDLATELVRMLMTKLSPDDVADFLSLQLAPEDGEFARLDLFVPCLLHAGRQSYSHAVALLVTYRTVLKEMIQKENAQFRLLTLLQEFWQKSWQHLETIVDKLQAHKFVKSDVIIKWCFQPDRAKLHYQPVWQALVMNALERTLKTAEGIEKSLIQARIDDEIAKEANDSSDEEDMGGDDEKNETSEKVRVLEHTLSEHKSFEADLFVVLFEQYKNTLQGLIESSGDNPEQNYMYQVQIQWLTAIARRYHRELAQHYDIIYELEFSDGEDGQIGCDPRIQKAFSVTRHIYGQASSDAIEEDD